MWGFQNTANPVHLYTLHTMEKTLSLDSKIEAVLFWKGEPVSEKELAKMFAVEKDELTAALTTLEGKISDRGLTLVRNGSGAEAEVMLYTAPAASEIIKNLTKEELARDITKAGVEVLSLIIYRGPIAKRDIDYIRGVNSSYILRNLLVRGLVQRTDSKNAGSFMYESSFELLAHLGVSRREDLPDFAEVVRDIETFMNTSTATKSADEKAPE
jgi:segregation and condensation protein B